MSTAVAPPSKFTEPATRKLRWAVLVIFAIAGILLGLLAANWPFTKQAMIKRLERASSARVEIHGFRSTYFPYPGCVAEDVTFHVQSTNGKQASKPIITIRNLKIESTFAGLLRKQTKIKSMIANGLLIHIPPEGANLHSQAGSKQDQLVIEELRAENAVLEVGSTQDQAPLVFRVHHVTFRNVNAKNTIPFEVSLHLPLPPGEVESYGWIGPWDENKSMRSTPVSGSYVLKRANLDVFSSLGGQFSSHGNFSGNLDHIEVEGSTESSDFEVKASGHKFRLNTQFRGAVNLQNGDVTLPALQASFGSTSFAGQLAVSGSPKTVSLNVTEGKGTIQDLILLFDDAPKSPIVGPIVFHANAVLPPEDRPFKERVQLTGDYKINPARFTSPNSQDAIDQLSERAKGKKDKKDHDADDDSKGYERVLTNLDGKVTLKNGTAVLSGTTFSVPGALGEMSGTYSLLSKRINFQGKMRMRATVSEASTGVKSFFLKVLDPFFKKKGAGAEVPIAMTGTYGHAHFTAGLK